MFRWIVLASCAWSLFGSVSVAATGVTDVEGLAAQLADTDPQTRLRVMVLLRNLPGEAMPEVEATLRRDGIASDVRSGLERALKFIRPRYDAQKREREASQWLHDFALAAYDKNPGRDPKWDASARKAIGWVLGPRDASTPPPQQALAELRKLAAGGCKDALVLYCRALLEQQSGMEAPQLTHYLGPMKEAAKASGYPTYLKCTMLLFPLPIAGGSREGEELLPEALKTPGLPPKLAWDLVSCSRLTVDGDTQEGLMEQVYPAYAAAFPKDVGPLAYKGMVYVYWAWYGHKNVPASKVSPEGWKLYRQRLALARPVLEAAWKLDPTDPRAPTEMINVCAGLGSSFQETMSWFSRAMAADPDNYEACQRVLFDLYPQWNQTAEAMLTFGRQCLETYNFRARLPSLLLEAHEAIAKNAGNEQKYYSQPAVWRDVRAVYQAWLWVEPDSTKMRSAYARMACRCGQWDEAKRQFDLLGDRVDLGAFGGKGLYDYFRRKAEKNSRQHDAKEAVGA